MPLSALTFLAFAIPPQVREPAPFPLAAWSAVVIDAETGKILYGRDIDTPRFPASTTKIMTALLLLERTKPGEMITAPKDVTKVGESSMHLKPGEKVSSRDLAWALMLRSANDGCYAAAVHMAGSVQKFSAMMNARAKEIGCEGTFFHNPNGLNDPKHTICARDLALIAREAMKNPEFSEIVRHRKHKIARQKGATDLWMVSKNKVLDKDRTADGIKTGWTIPAGHTYVGSATRNGRRLITAILNSGNWVQDHENLLSYGYKNFVATTVAQRLQMIGQVSVSSGERDSVPAGPREDVASVSRVGSEAPKVEVTASTVEAPVNLGQSLGKATITDADGFRRDIDLVALASVARAPLAVPVAAGRSSVGLWALGGGLFAAGGWVLLRPKPGARRAPLRGL